MVIITKTLFCFLQLHCSVPCISLHYSGVLVASQNIVYLTQTAGYQEDQRVLLSLPRQIGCAGWRHPSPKPVPPPQEGMGKPPGEHRGCENSLSRKHTTQLTAALSPPEFVLFSYCFDSKIFPQKALHREKVNRKVELFAKLLWNSLFREVMSATTMHLLKHPNTQTSRCFVAVKQSVSFLLCKYKHRRC